MSDLDIELFKTQAKGQIIIGSEDIDSRMNSIAINEMVFGEYRAVDDVIRDLEKINRSTLLNYIEDKLKIEERSLFVLGQK